MLQGIIRCKGAAGIFRKTRRPQRRFCGQGLWMLALLSGLSGCGTQEAKLGTADYTKIGFTSHCAPRERLGPAGASNGRLTDDGIHYNVRTPANYDPVLAHPLLVVYAAAGQSAFAAERHTGLTEQATGAGMIVAYVDSRRLSIPTIMAMAKVPLAVAKEWCIDEKKIYLTGHSDGGTVAMAVAFLPETSLIPRAIAPSAAGIRRADLESYACPAPLSVMVLHSRDDKLFPGYGAEATTWWAACNRCDPHPLPPDATGCVSYAICEGGVMTRYCEDEGEHSRWPARNEELLKFLASAPPRPATAFEKAR